jgi:hypothetical protein
MSAVRGCLLNIFAATLHTVGRFSIRNMRARHVVGTSIHLSRFYEIVPKLSNQRY